MALAVRWAIFAGRSRSHGINGIIRMFNRTKAAMARLLGTIMVFESASFWQPST
jgi:hypothetical protein